MKVYFSKNSHFIVVILCVSLLSCAGGGRGGNERWGQYDPEFDSIVAMLDRPCGQAWTEIWPGAVKRLDSIAAKRGDVRMRATARYWRARLLYSSRHISEARAMVGLAMQDVDSVRDRYGYHRMRTLRAQIDSENDISNFQTLMKDVDYYRSVHDTLMEATSTVTLGNNLASAGFHAEALGYLQRADTLLLMAGIEGTAMKNRLNIAAQYDALGQSAKADSLLQAIRRYPSVQDDRNFHLLLLRNIFVRSGDVDVLHAACRDMERAGYNGHEWHRIHVLLGKYYLDSARMQMDSIRHCVMAVKGSVEHEPNLSYRAMAYEMLSRSMEAEGSADSALVYLKRSYLYADSARNAVETLEIQRIKAENEYRRIVEKGEHEHALTRTRYAVVAMVALIFAGVVLVIFYRRNARHRLHEAKTDLERERQQRQLMAISLAVEETDQMSRNLGHDLKEMQEAGRISAADVARINARLREHAVASTEWKYFEAMFRDANPHFVTRMHQRYPGLSVTQHRLAAYIFIGLTIQQISRHLNVRPESVMQARWRLKQKMGLGEDESLEDALHALNAAEETC